MAWVYLVICLAVIFYIVTAGNVGRLRAKHGILAPCCTGHPEFERAFRVQQNTLEQLAPFLPMVYFFGQLVSPVGAALLGALWIASRILYMRSYMADPLKRGPGMIMTVLTLVALTLGVVAAAVTELVHA